MGLILRAVGSTEGNEQRVVGCDLSNALVVCGEHLARRVGKQERSTGYGTQLEGQ